MTCSGRTLDSRYYVSNILMLVKHKQPKLPNPSDINSICSSEENIPRNDENQGVLHPTSAIALQPTIER